MTAMVVYWIELDLDGNLQSRYKLFPEEDLQIRKVLDECAELRAEGKLFVTSTSDLCIGVSGIIDGKLPDGTTYQWRKRRPY